MASSAVVCVAGRTEMSQEKSHFERIIFVSVAEAFVATAPIDGSFLLNLRASTVKAA